MNSKDNEIEINKTVNTVGTNNTQGKSKLIIQY